MRSFHALVCAVAAAPLIAQSFTVDQASGPGTDFTSLAAAIAAVPDGSVLTVRAGNYFEFADIDGKSLTILGEPGSTVFAPFNTIGIRIANIAATQVVVIQGLQLVSNTSVVSAVLRCLDSQGLIFVDGMAGTGGRVLVATHCDALLMRQCTFAGQGQSQIGCDLNGCSGVFDQCGLLDTRQTGGSVQFTHCAMTGTTGLLTGGGAALTVDSANARIGGGYVNGGMSFGGPPGPAITGSGTVRLDPSTGIFPAGTVGPAVLTQMPLVAAQLLTGTPDVQASLLGPAGDLGVLFVSTRSLPFAIPGLDPFWLNGTVSSVQAFGVLSPGTPVQSVTTPPTDAALRGLALVWQGMTFAANGTLQVGNPAWHVLR